VREYVKCERCENAFPWNGIGERPVTCALCLHLGDRSLVWLLRDPTPERLALFRAAPPGHLRFQRETGGASAPQGRTFRGDPRHERG
jgi:hypothetical protein